MKKYRNTVNRIAPFTGMLFVLALWYFLTEGKVVEKFMLPSPVDVCRALRDNFFIIADNAWITVKEAVYGLVAGIAVSFVFATVMDRFNFIYKAFYPVFIISQTIPTIAIAPMLVVWMGFDMAPKITMVIITTFFPVTISLLDGYKSADPDAVNLMRSMGASRFEIFRHLKFFSALPAFFSGLKISASYAVVSALVAEWMGGFEGLGVYMTRVKKAYAFDKMFAVIIVICVISLLLMALVCVLEKLCMPWKKEQKN